MNTQGKIILHLPRLQRNFIKQAGTEEGALGCPSQQIIILQYISFLALQIFLSLHFLASYVMRLSSCPAQPCFIPWLYFILCNECGTDSIGKMNQFKSLQVATQDLHKWDILSPWLTILRLSILNIAFRLF